MTTKRGTGERAATPSAPSYIQIVDPQGDARALAKEIAQKRAEGWTPTESRPGGYFLGTDGEPHDAWGNKIPRE